MNPKLRSKARYYALQALYQWQMSGQSVLELEEQFSKSLENDAVDEAYFSAILYGVTQNTKQLDQQFQPYLDRKLEELTPIELSVLRLASYELLNCRDVPFKVVINEALELVKTFGATDDGYKYVNGVLDRVAKGL